MRNLRGRTAFITGAASGIGLGMARAFAEAGMNLVLTDVNGDDLAAAGARLADEGATVLAQRLDVTDRTAWREAGDAAESRFGGIDLLCNNAGIVAMGWDVDTLPPDLWDLTVAINLNGLFYGTHEILPHMKRRARGGHIVNTGSVSSLRGRASHAVYVATKHAVLGFSESLAQEVRPHGIGVSILCPGHVNTNLNRNSQRRRDNVAADASPGGEDAGITGPEALDPLSVGRRVREAVEDDRFFIITHPDYRSIVEARHAELMAAFDHADAQAQRS